RRVILRGFSCGGYPCFSPGGAEGSADKDQEYDKRAFGTFHLIIIRRTGDLTRLSWRRTCGRPDFWRAISILGGWWINGPFAHFQARHAVPGIRNQPQTLQLDLRAAVVAYAVGSRFESADDVIDQGQFLAVDIGDRESNIFNEVGQPLVSQVQHRFILGMMVL